MRGRPPSSSAIWNLGEESMTPVKPIRVMIVDDHAMVRRGLAAFLMARDDLVLVGEASNGLEALELCRQMEPNVVLMDLLMPEMDGVTAIRLIRARFPRVQIIVLTSFQEEELIQQALQAGAISYLLKNISAEGLYDAIQSASIGQAVLAPEALRVMVGTPDSKPELGYDLTRREREVLALMAQGLNNPQIAQQLNTSRSTIKTHVSNILSKLGASSRAEATSLALHHRLVP